MRRDEDYLQDLIESMFGLNNIMYNNVPKYKPRKDAANRNVEVDSTGDAVNITMDLPGVELADINLEVDEFNIVITAKNGVRNYKFNRTFKFSLDADKAKATFKNGVLNVSVEKVAKPDMKRVTIEG
jgi:HSP20 family protein